VQYSSPDGCKFSQGKRVCITQCLKAGAELKKLLFRNEKPAGKRVQHYTSILSPLANFLPLRRAESDAQVTGKLVPVRLSLREESRTGLADFTTCREPTTGIMPYHVLSHE
jgi:hypothetical protein